MTQRTKLSSRFLSLFLAMLMIVSMIPATVFAAPASDIPDEMLDNVYLDALAYTYTTDKNGYILTDYYVCGDGWNIREISPSEGYLLDESIYWLDVEPGQYTFEKNTEELDVYENII